ncbi:hypothetical protein [Sulfitobacter sp. R18_1]|uniref:hypothetical protein n=1 Tax=Sulfitobacter sp. R18_1 TaxID=2821104 RepID=UPI001ADA5337|nr:hypothetical protein [Sulfitobacter sp. R18_1]MBO9428854.1 hypothetical protein [Sulfitobacter sp. R18_1]
MDDNSKIARLEQQRNSANQALSTLKAKMKDIRNTHKTEFGPAVAFLEGLGDHLAAAKLKEGQKINDDFMRGQKWTVEQTIHKLNRLRPQPQNEMEPKSGWSAPGEELRKLTSRMKRNGVFTFFDSYMRRDDFLEASDAFLEGMQVVAAELLKIDDEYKPWKVEGEPDYSFETARRHMLREIEEITVISILEHEGDLITSLAPSPSP